MPTYDYVCGKCEYAFEEFQSIKAAPLKKCPACGKPALKRLMGTGGGLIFKGSGFYTTDYRSESYKKAADGDSKPKTEAKPEQKAESPAPAKASGETPKIANSPAKSPGKKRHD